MSYQFKAKLKKLEGKMNWTVFYFPYSVEEEFKTKGRVQVNIEVDGHLFKTTLLPSKNGHYIVYNQQIKKIVKKELGEEVSIHLTKDNEKREIKIPDYINKELEKNYVLDQFLNHPNYIKREEINKIETAKKDETKQRRIKKLIEKLTTK